MDERAGEAAAAVVGMRLDGLETREAGAGGDEAHLRDELPVEEGAEPGAVPCRRKARLLAARRLTKRRWRSESYVSLQPSAARRAEPIGIGLERAVGRVAVRVGRRMHGGGRHHGGRLDLEAVFGEAERSRGCALRIVEPERPVPGLGEGGDEPSSHSLDPLGGRHPVEEQEVAPVEARIRRGRDDEVVARDRRSSTPSARGARGRCGSRAKPRPCRRA